MATISSIAAESEISARKLSKPVTRQTWMRGRVWLTAPALLAALCFACGDAATWVVWIPAGRLLVGLALLLVVGAVATWRVERFALLPAGAVCLLLGMFCAEVQPRAASESPLSRIAEAMPAANPATRRQGIETSSLIHGTVVRASAVRRTASPVPYSDAVREEQSQQVDVRVTAVDGKPLPAPEGLRLTVLCAGERGYSRDDLRCGGAGAGGAAGGGTVSRSGRVGCRSVAAATGD